MTTLPPNKHPIGCKWVDHIKFKINGSIEHYTSSLVAKGQEDIDYFDTFSLVAKLVTVKKLLALASIYSWSLTQLDVNNTFLHADLNDEVYMNLPPGFCCERELTLPVNTICKLHK